MRRAIMISLGIVLSSLSCAQGAEPVAREPYGIGLEGFAYPYPVHLLPLVNDGEQVRMAYMDVASAQPTGRTVVLLTGRGLAFVGHAFELARELAPATIVFEDIDLVAAERTMYMGDNGLLFSNGRQLADLLFDLFETFPADCPQLDRLRTGARRAARPPRARTRKARRQRTRLSATRPRWARRPRPPPGRV